MLLTTIPAQRAFGSPMDMPWPPTDVVVEVISWSSSEPWQGISVAYRRPKRTRRAPPWTDRVHLREGVIVDCVFTRNALQVLITSGVPWSMEEPTHVTCGPDADAVRIWFVPPADSCVGLRHPVVGHLSLEGANSAVTLLKDEEPFPLQRTVGSRPYVTCEVFHPERMLVWANATHSPGRAWCLALDDASAPHLVRVDLDAPILAPADCP